MGIGLRYGILLAQYWGANDEQGLKRYLALGTGVTQGLAFFCFAVCVFTPTLLPSLFNPSETVLALASDYVQLLGIAVCLSGFGIAADTALRSIGQTRINLYVSILETALNITFNYILIFGHLGMPAMGLIGAGIGSVIARSIRLLVVLVIIYRYFPVLALRWQNVVEACERRMVSKFFTVTYPIMVGTVIWCAGLFTFNILLGRIGQAELATIAVITPLESIGLAFGHGLSTATGIMIGNSLGANQFKHSTQYSRWALKSSIVLGALLGGVLLVAQSAILSLYGALSDDVTQLMIMSFPIVALSIMLRTINITLIIGVLRSGGDSKFCMNMDFVCQWMWAVPVTAMGAIVFELPFTTVLLLMTSEEIIKVLPAAWRVYSDKWVNNLTENTERSAA